MAAELNLLSVRRFKPEHSCHDNHRRQGGEVKQVSEEYEAEASQSYSVDDHSPDSFPQLDRVVAAAAVREASAAVFW